RLPVARELTEEGADDRRLTVGVRAEGSERRRDAHAGRHRRDREKRPRQRRVRRHEQDQEGQGDERERSVDAEREVHDAEERRVHTVRDALHRQPFMPLVAMPSTKKRWPSRKMMAIGTTEITRPAKSTP